MQTLSMYIFYVRTYIIIHTRWLGGFNIYLCGKVQPRIETLLLIQRGCVSLPTITRLMILLPSRPNGICYLLDPFTIYIKNNYEKKLNA